MKRIALVLCIAAIARADSPAPLPQDAIDALTAIDVVPTQTQLTTALKATTDTAARDQLIGILQDTDPNHYFFGVRLRAIQGLAKYCSSPCLHDDPAHLALVAVITANNNAMGHAGTSLLLLRAAVESVGPLRANDNNDDLNLLVQLLQTGQRDVRAAAAHALRDLCNSGAITWLQKAYNDETIPEVKLAISEALRALPCPVN